VKIQKDDEIPEIDFGKKSSSTSSSANNNNNDDDDDDIPEIDLNTLSVAEAKTDKVSI
jgi:hypothetical protein